MVGLVETAVALWRVIETRGFPKENFEVRRFTSGATFRPDFASVELRHPHCAPVRCSEYRTTDENMIGALRGFIAWIDFLETKCHVVAHNEDGTWVPGVIVSHKKYY